MNLIDRLVTGGTLPQRMLPLLGDIGTQGDITWLVQQISLDQQERIKPPYEVDILNLLARITPSLKLSDIKGAIKQEGGVVFGQSFVWPPPSRLITFRWTPFEHGGQVWGFFWGAHRGKDKVEYNVMISPLLRVAPYKGADASGESDELLNALLIWSAIKLRGRFDDLDPNSAYRKAGAALIKDLQDYGCIANVSLFGYGHDKTGDPLPGEPFIGTVDIKQPIKKVIKELRHFLKQKYRVLGGYNTPYRCLYCGEIGSGHGKRRFCCDSHRVLYWRRENASR